MSKGVQTFRQSDLTKALKGAAAGGIKVTRVEIDRSGKIVVIAGREPDTDADKAETPEDLRNLL